MSGGSTVTSPDRSSVTARPATRYRAQLFDGGRGERGRVIGLGAGVPQHPEQFTHGGQGGACWRAALAGRATDPEPDLGAIGDMALSLVSLAVLTPVVFLVTQWIGRRRPATLSSVEGRLRLRWLGTCMLVAAAAMVLLQVGVRVAYQASGFADADR